MKHYYVQIIFVQFFNQISPIPDPHNFSLRFMSLIKLRIHRFYNTIDFIRIKINDK